MLWIGLTGPMGSGKSTVADLLRQMGFAVLDADLLARKILDPGQEGEAEVFKTFGESLKGPDGTLDRRALGRLVFADEVKLKQLESIVHPRVQQEVAREKERLNRAGHPAAFYDVPLLFEKNLQNLFDHVLVVSAPSELRMRRVQERSKLTPAEILERNANHLAPELKEKAADAVILNQGSFSDLRAQVLSALKKVGVDLPTATQP